MGFPRTQLSGKVNERFSTFRSGRNSPISTKQQQTTHHLVSEFQMTMTTFFAKLLTDDGFSGMVWVRVGLFVCPAEEGAGEKHTQY
jgi:hypothetical protein